MTPTHSGVLQITRESLAMIRSAINDLPEEALDWKPLPSANSAAVLVAHAVTATRFFLRAGSGNVGSLIEYRATERAEAFRTAGISKARLLEMLSDFSAEAESIVAEGTEEHLNAPVSMPSNDNLTVPDRNGAGTLFAAIGHLREHVGHLQLMHDLWRAEHPNA
ncbi:MAG: DinB family protein [Dehalococcoidia bacterium]